MNQPDYLFGDHNLRLTDFVLKQEVTITILLIMSFTRFNLTIWKLYMDVRQ